MLAAPCHNVYRPDSLSLCLVIFFLSLSLSPPLSHTHISIMQSQIVKLKQHVKLISDLLCDLELSSEQLYILLYSISSTTIQRHVTCQYMYHFIFCPIFAIYLFIMYICLSIIWFILSCLVVVIVCLCDYIYEKHLEATNNDKLQSTQHTQHQTSTNYFIDHREHQETIERQQYQCRRQSGSKSE